MSSPRPAAYMAFTAPINPAGASPVLTRPQIWRCLQRKVHHAEEFVGGAIKTTEVLSESKDEMGRDVVTRYVIFAEGNKKIKEVCTFFEDMKVEFIADDLRVLNTVSDSADGQIYLTYQFEWTMEHGTPVEKQQANIKQWRGMSQVAIESSVKTMREMVKDGRVK